MTFPETLLLDLRYGVRMLHRNVGFAAVAILALGLGIGVNTAVFTAYKAMVARPLDARNPDEMVNLALVNPSGATQFTFSYPDYETYRDAIHSFSGLIAFVPDRVVLSNAGRMVSQRASAAESPVGKLGLLSLGVSGAEFASTFVVSENYFEVLGARAFRGRTFDSAGMRELLASPSVLISENYWQKRFSGDPAVLGKTIRLNGAPVTVMGITPRNFVGTGIAVPDFWLPICLAPLVHADDRWLRDRDNRRCRLFGRLAPGATAEHARAEMMVLADRLSALHDPKGQSATPTTALVWHGSPFPLPLSSYPGLKSAVGLILFAAAMVLVVACANVGSLQLARARSRLDELLTRLSVGASRARVTRQLLTESVLLGVVAGVAALPFTWGLLRVSVALVADALPPEFGTLVFDVTPDLAIFACVSAVSVFAGILVGLAPAVESSRATLAASARASTAPARSRRIQDVLIAAQVGFTLVLLIAGSTLIRGSINLLQTDPGCDSKHLAVLNLQFPEASKYTSGRKEALRRELRARLAALPAVAAITSARPPGEGFRTAAVALDGGGSASPGRQAVLLYTYVEANYFGTLGIPFLAGRGFQSEGGQAEPSVILSESAAGQLWPGQNPVGRGIRLGATGERMFDSAEVVAGGPAYQVIGVVRDTRGVEFDGSGSKQVYLPLPVDRAGSYPLIVRTRSDAAALVRAIDTLVPSVDPDLLGASATIEAMLRESGPFIVSSLSAAVASTVGLLGLLLAALGIYGTVSYVVVHRTREIGIRMALGARTRDVIGLILRESTRPVVAGLLLGMVLAIGVSQLLRGLLYGLRIVDGISLAGGSLLLLAVALVAAYAPARRASSVDPNVALRCE